jgi:hypothetical protein
LSRRENRKVDKIKKRGTVREVGLGGKVLRLSQWKQQNITSGIFKTVWRRMERSYSECERSKSLQSFSCRKNLESNFK